MFWRIKTNTMKKLTLWIVFTILFFTVSPYCFSQDTVIGKKPFIREISSKITPPHYIVNPYNGEVVELTNEQIINHEEGIPYQMIFKNRGWWIESYRFDPSTGIVKDQTRLMTTTYWIVILIFPFFGFNFLYKKHIHTYKTQVILYLVSLSPVVLMSVALFAQYYFNSYVSSLLCILFPILSLYIYFKNYSPTLVGSIVFFILMIGMVFLMSGAYCGFKHNIVEIIMPLFTWGLICILFRIVYDAYKYSEGKKNFYLEHYDVFWYVVCSMLIIKHKRTVFYCPFFIS